MVTNLKSDIEKHLNITDGMILGTEIHHWNGQNYVKQQEKLYDLNETHAIINSLMKKCEGIQLDEQNPIIEFERDDRVRVKITIPPLSNLPTVVFRSAN